MVNIVKMVGAKHDDNQQLSAMTALMTATAALLPLPPPPAPLPQTSLLFVLSLAIVS